MAVLIGVLVLTAVILLPYVNTLTLAVVIGIIFTPVADRLAKMLRNRGVAAFVTLVIALVLVVTPLAFFGIQAGQEALSLYEHVTRDHTVGELTAAPLPLRNVISQLPVAVQDALPSQIDVGPILRSAGSWAVARVGSLFSIITTLSLDLFLLIIGTYYVLKDGKRFARYLIKVAPLNPEYEDILFKKLHASVISVVRGAIAIAVLQGVAAGLGFFLFGVPNAALWGAATMVAALVPIVGTSVTLIPAVLYLLIVGKTISAVLLLIWGILGVGFIDNLFRGQFMKKGLNLHPFFILLSVLGGLEFFGPIGFITGPILLSVLATLLDIYTVFEEKVEKLDASATLAS